MKRSIILFIALSWLLTACSIFEDTASTEVESTTNTDTEQTTTTEQEQAPVVVEEQEMEVVVEEEPAPVVEDTSADETVAEAPQQPAQTVAYNGPAWTVLPLTNARTGETFMLADFAGKTVFVEPMATWCSNCRAQQQRVMQAMGEVNAEDFVFISLSVEGIPDANLASYADRNGFEQTFVVATPDLLNALAEQYGRSILSPPSTPHFIIAPDGTTSNISLGAKSSDAILQEVLSVANS